METDERESEERKCGEEEEEGSIEEETISLLAKGKYIMISFYPYFVLVFF